MSESADAFSETWQEGSGDEPVAVDKIFINLQNVQAVLTNYGATLLSLKHRTTRGIFLSSSMRTSLYDSIA